MDTPIVTALYAPASRPELLPKAMASGADAVIVDLEDAVLAGRKEEARANVLAFLDGLAEADAGPSGSAELGERGRSADGSPSGSAEPSERSSSAGERGEGPADSAVERVPTIPVQRGRSGGSRERGAEAGARRSGPHCRPVVQVRVNHPRGEFGPRDLAALGAHPVVRAGRIAVRLPKVAGPRDVDLALDMLNVDAPLAVHCLLESAIGVEYARDIAAHPAVAGLALGEADLAAELGLRGEESFGWIRSRIVIAAVAAGLPAPAMAVYTDLADPRGLAESCARGRALGMFGRTALHPKQLSTIAAAFAPDGVELRRAHEVVTAAAGAEADGSGAIALPDGRFIDAPMVESAKRTIQLAERLG